MKSIKSLLRDSFKHRRSPDISIVMSSFNQGEFIEKSIRSVLDQNIQGLELIIMDGGSEDGTLQVLEKLSLQAEGQLSWYSTADRGAAHAINKALMTWSN